MSPGISHIIVDAMGGDKGPRATVRGAVRALRQARGSLKVTLVGPVGLLEQEMKRALRGKKEPHLQVVHAKETITMEDSPAQVVRGKKDSSIHQGLLLLKQAQADAFLSAGNSGAVMAIALTLLGRLKHVERPAIAVHLPTVRGHAILIDAGANVDCKPSHLFQFGRMGAQFARLVGGIEQVRVALLSNGQEIQKGNEVVRLTHQQMLHSDEFQYVGYVEGNDLFQGVADVVVTDGFVGNIVLKSSEGLASTVSRWFRREFKFHVFGLLGYYLMKRILKKFRNQFDYAKVGAAPLLGVDGLVFISHGKSSEKAICNGILLAQKTVASSFMQSFKNQMESQSLEDSGFNEEANGPKL